MSQTVPGDFNDMAFTTQRALTQDEHETLKKKKKKKEERKQSRVVGATTAGFRALASQVFALYVRVPVKLFRPTRIE